MKTSIAGLSFIAKWEGESLHVYKDVAGIPTIGVGHVLRPGESFPDGITHDQALELLAEDIRIAESTVRVHAPATVGQNAFDACVSFTFNCGGGAFAGSSLLHLLNAGDMAGAGDAFLAWDKRKDPQTGALVVDRGLLARRTAERALFLTPDAVVAPPSPLAPDTAPGLDVEAEAVGDEKTDVPAA